MNQINPSRRNRKATTRPEIWSSGSQKPKFDFKAYAEVSLMLTREGLGPLLDRAGLATAQFAARVDGGFLRIPEDRLGRTGHYLPSHRRVARWLDGSAGILRQAGVTAFPALETDADPGSYENGLSQPGERGTVVTSRPATQSGDEEPILPEPAVEVPDPERDTARDEADALSAIRSVLAEEPTTAAAPGRASKFKARRAATAPDVPSGPSWLGTAFVTLAGKLLGWALICVALPYGLVKALLAHLNGTDLREMADGD
jgi:hypothetical protein